MKLISPQIKQQYFYDNGDPLDGGKLFTYVGGTVSTPVETYTTEEGDASNSNPIILDSRGEVAGLFLSPGSYKFVLKDSLDNTIWTEDNITVRDVGAELDDLESQITTINTAISTESIINRIVSGEASPNSSKARFLVPIGTANQAKILADDTDLIYFVNAVQYTISADLVASGLVSAPVTNNTALINDSNLADQDSTRTLGMFGTSIVIDTIGSEISNRNGQIAAFKIVGTSTEYFTARIDSTNSRLIEADRGPFYDKDGNPIEACAFSNNDTITLAKLTWLYLKTTGTMLASYTEPVYSTTEPDSPLDGDMWYDFSVNKWFRFSSTAYEDAGAVFIGTCIQDENGNTVGARPDDFYASRNNTNTFLLKYQDTTSVRTESRQNTVSVNGNSLKFFESYQEFNIVSDLEDSYTEAASTWYYPYKKENGDSVISPVPPLDQRGSLLGFYHPYEMWRYVGGKVYNNASSNFDATSVVNSPENTPSVNSRIISTTANHTVTRENEVILCDATSGSFTETLYTAVGNGGKIVTINKTDSSVNTITIDGNGSETVGGSLTKVLRFNGDSLKLLSDNANWQIIGTVRIQAPESLLCSDFIGLGSGNTAVPYFGTLTTNTLSKIASMTYNDTTNGAILTALAPCSVSFNHRNSSTSIANIGIVKNGSASDLDTDIQSVTQANVVASGRQHDANTQTQVSFSGTLAIGDTLAPIFAGETPYTIAQVQGLAITVTPLADFS